MQTGVLNAGVDGHGAVSALRREKHVVREALRGHHDEEAPWAPSSLWDEGSGRSPRARGQASALCDPGKARGSPCLGSLHGARCGGRAPSSGPGPPASLLPRLHPSSPSQPTGREQGLWSLEELVHLPASPLPGWLTFTLY